MGTDKEDTDPSSPSALRPSMQPPGGSAVAHALNGPPPPQPTTDPGLGPPSDTPPPSARRPMSVTVPAPSVRPRPGPSAITPPEFRPIAGPSRASSSTKDSVELLLEGMAGPRPDRRKTKPQSDGEASAAYHSEHGVRRARTSEPAGPKVVVERPAPAGLPARARSSPRPVKVGAGPQDALSTFVPARVLRRRVAMAVVAGVLFVLLSFMALRLSGRREVPAAASGAETMGPARRPPRRNGDVPPPLRRFGRCAHSGGQRGPRSLRSSSRSLRAPRHPRPRRRMTTRGLRMPRAARRRGITGPPARPFHPVRVATWASSRRSL